MVYAKALVGAIIAALTALATALVPAVEGGSAVVSPAEWVTVLLAFVVAFGAVWSVPNAAPADSDL